MESWLMRGIGVSWVVLGLLVGCGHELVPPPRLEAEKRTTEARKKLGEADISAARTHYQEALTVDPENREARFGVALTDVLMLDEFPAVQEFLDRCHQPQFDGRREIYGPGGMLDRVRVRNLGQFDVTAHVQPRPDAALIGLDVLPHRVEVDVLPSGPGYPRELIVWSSGGPPGSLTSFWLSINLDDALTGDSTATPVVAGLEVPLGRLGGDMVFSSGSDTFYAPTGTSASAAAARGSLRFTAFGSVPGDAVEIELVDVVLPAGSCAVTGPCARDGVVKLSGRIRDVVSDALVSDLGRLPFGAIEAREGPPAMDEWAVAIERCDPLLANDMAEMARSLGAHLASIASTLAPIGGAADANAFSFAIPKELLFLGEDVSVHLADVLALEAWLELSAAFIDLAANYKSYEGSLQAMLSTYCDWAPGDPGEGEEDPEPVCVERRGLAAFALHANLGTNLFDERPSFDVGPFRARLAAGLETAAAAFRARPAGRGILEPQANAIASASSRVAEALDAVRRSIDSEEAQVLPESNIRVHLKRYFDAPLDRDRMLMLSNLSSLIELSRGDLSSREPWERSDRLELPDVDLATVLRALDHVIEFSSDEDLPWYMNLKREGVWQSAREGDRGPAFISTEFKAVQAFWDW